jgi:hypothetical protein
VNNPGIYSLGDQVITTCADIFSPKIVTLSGLTPRTTVLLAPTDAGLAHDTVVEGVLLATTSRRCVIDGRTTTIQSCDTRKLPDDIGGDRSRFQRNNHGSAVVVDHHVNEVRCRIRREIVDSNKLARRMRDGSPLSPKPSS